MLGYDVEFSIIYAIMASQSGDTALDRRVGNYSSIGLDDMPTNIRLQAILRAPYF